jgi:two-component system, NarL family, sensor kinase
VDRDRNAEPVHDPRFVDRITHIAAIAIERKRVEEALRHLSRLVIEAQEAERRRVARELHDGVNQLLSSVAFRVEAIQGKMAGVHEHLRDETQRAKVLLTKAIQEVRKISENLRPSELDALGLLPAVRSLCDELEERTGLEIELVSEGLPPRLSPELELTLFRILQESLANIEKHAGAHRVMISLRVSGSALDLNIRDDGQGFRRMASGRADSAREGMGLVNIRERSAFVGGTVAFRSANPGGTEVAVRIPLAHPETPIMKTAGYAIQDIHSSGR